MALTLTRRSTALLPCEPAVVYDVLTDYDTYSEWMPFAIHSKLLAREGDLAIAEFGFRRPRKSKMVAECIHSRDQTVLGRTIGGGVPVAKIEWNLAPAQGGGTQVSIAVEAKAHWRWLMPGCGHFLAVRKLLRALQTQLTAFTVSAPAEDSEKILELVETSEGLVVWFRGQKFFLTPASEQRP